MKFLTKLLANRLQKIVTSLIHKNKYGFIKSRSIHDYLAWAFEYLPLCHMSKKEIINYQLDFEKAFGKVECSAILSMLKHMVFGDKFIGWIKSILYIASTSILLNGVPGKILNAKEE